MNQFFYVYVDTSTIDLISAGDIFQSTKKKKWISNNTEKFLFLIAFWTHTYTHDNNNKNRRKINVGSRRVG